MTFSLCRPDQKFVNYTRRQIRPRHSLRFSAVQSFTLLFGRQKLHCHLFSFLLSLHLYSPHCRPVPFASRMFMPSVWGCIQYVRLSVNCLCFFLSYWVKEGHLCEIFEESRVFFYLTHTGFVGVHWEYNFVKKKLKGVTVSFSSSTLFTVPSEQSSHLKKRDGSNC